jgi:hypothetical protein
VSSSLHHRLLEVAGLVAAGLQHGELGVHVREDGGDGALFGFVGWVANRQLAKLGLRNYIADAAAFACSRGLIKEGLRLEGIGAEAQVPVFVQAQSNDVVAVAGVRNILHRHRGCGNVERHFGRRREEDIPLPNSAPRRLVGRCTNDVVKVLRANEATPVNVHVIDEPDRRLAGTNFLVHTCPRDSPKLAKLLNLPLAVEAEEAGLASQELLHGGLFEVALLGDEPI